MRSTEYDRRSPEPFGENARADKSLTANGNPEQIPQTVRTSIIDFKTEIRYHEPVNPLYDQEPVKPSGGLGRMPVDVGID